MDHMNINNKICTQIKNEAFSKDSVILEKIEDNYNNKRMWWVQAEAVIAFINAYQKFNNESFLKCAEQIWDFIKENLIEKTPEGEWFAGVSENIETPLPDNIVDHWKGPYHNARMCLEVSLRLES